MIFFWIGVYLVASLFSVGLAVLTGAIIARAEWERPRPKPAPEPEPIQPEVVESLLILCDRYCAGEITPEVYFAAVEHLTKDVR